MPYGDILTVAKLALDDIIAEPREPEPLLLAKYLYQGTTPFGEGDETVFTFSKADNDQQQVFGWASVVKKDGQVVLDRQQDLIEVGDLEKAAYDFMLKADGRIGGVMHTREEGVSKSPKVVSKMIESMVFTPEKIEKLGLPDEFPQGWWVGYQVTDPEVWKGVRSKRWGGFSVHGVGKRTDV